MAHVCHVALPGCVAYHDAALRWQLSDIPLSSHLGFGLAIAMMTLHHGWHASK